jgi:transcriptional regulator with XRE-family HTH domain
MPATDDPAVARRQISGRLKEERSQAKLSREDVAETLDWSLSKLRRMEEGEQGVSATDLRALLDLYDVTDAGRIKAYTALARGTRARPYFSDYRDVISPQLAQLLGYESAAEAIRVFHPLLLPGLLHTAEYALAVLSARMPEDQARRIVELRMVRQERVLRQENPPRISFAFGEEALGRPIGGPAILRKQLQHVVAVRVVPLSAAAYAGLIGPFTLATLTDPEDAMLFIETATEDLLIRDDEGALDQFAKDLEGINAAALSQADTRTLISQRIDQLSGAERQSRDHQSASSDERAADR